MFKVNAVVESLGKFALSDFSGLASRLAAAAPTGASSALAKPHDALASPASATKRITLLRIPGASACSIAPPHVALEGANATPRNAFRHSL
jgi:hypothetical protein